jgi:dTMP kinase
MLPATEALLYAGARAQHVGQLIEPALLRGSIVLCDRFVDSSLAYQSGGMGLPMTDVVALQHLSTRGVEPDLRVLLDLPVKVGLARRLGAPDEVNRLDLADVAFHNRVRSTYLALAAGTRDRWIVVDATATPDRVEAVIAGAVDRLLVEVGGSGR